MSASRRPSIVNLLLFTLAFASLSRIFQAFPAVAAMRPLLLLALASAAMMFLIPGSIEPQNLVRSWPPKILAALGVMACISAPFGISFGGSAGAFLYGYSKTLALAFFLVVAIRSVRDLRLFVWAYVLAAGTLCYFSIFVFDLVSDGGMSVQRLDDMYTYDANDAGLVLVVGIPLALLVFQTSRLKGRVVAGVILLATAVSLARGGSRGAFLGLASVTLLLLLLARDFSVTKRVAIVIALFLGLAFAAPQGYWRQMNTITQSTDYNWYQEEGRIAIWKRGLGYMAERPFFGVGFGNFARAEGTISEYAKNAAPGSPVRWNNPHNSFVQTGAEMGVPGVILFAALVFGGIVGPLRLRRRIRLRMTGQREDDRILYLALTYIPVSVAGFAVSGFFLSFAYFDVIYVLTAYVTGLYILTTSTARQPAGRNQAVRLELSGARSSQESTVRGRFGQVRLFERRTPNKRRRSSSLGTWKAGTRGGAR